MAHDFSRFSTWAITGLARMMDRAGVAYVPYSETHAPYQRRRVRQRTGKASTSAETLAEGNEGALHLGPERARVYTDLSPEEKDRYNADIRATNILLQGLPKDIYTLTNHYTDAKDIWDNVKILLEVKLNRGLRDSNYDQLYAYLKQHEAHANENKMMLDQFTQQTVDPLALMSNVSHQQYYSQSSTTLPSTHVQPHFANNTQFDSGLSPTDNLIENLNNILALLIQSYETYLPQTNNQLKTSSNTRNQATVQDGVAGNGGAQNRVGNVNPAQENGVALDEEQLLFIASGQDTVVDEDVDEKPVQDLALNVDNIFQADDCDAFDSDVDEAPTAHTMFMANLSLADPVYDEASPLYDSNILSEVHDHDNYQDAICEHHEVHEIHNDVQQNCVVDFDAEYMSDSNMISYDQYVKDNAESVIQINVSSVPNDAYMMIINEMHEQTAQCVSVNNQNKVVNASLTAELARYKEQVELYERRANFKLNKREQKIKEQLRIIITDHNIKEENLKKELHSVKMQLNSTINHNNSMIEEVTSLKTDFQQKENKYLEEILDMKALKKVEDRLFKQDQFVHTVHMLCKPKSFYDENNKVAIGYKNPFYLSKAKQVQPGLYNGHEIVKTSHDHALIHDSKETLEIAETTRKQTLEKINDPECVKKKVKIAPHNYSKENYLATFTPQKQLTTEQIFWSNDLIKIHAKALSAKAKSANPNRAITVYHPNIHAKLTLTELCSRADLCNIEKDNSSYGVTLVDVRLLVHTQVWRWISEVRLYMRGEVRLCADYSSSCNPDSGTTTEHLTHAFIRLHHVSITRYNPQVQSKRTDDHSRTSEKLSYVHNIIVLSPGMYSIDVEPIPPHNRNNREAHLDYLRHLKESGATLCKIVEEARVEKPLDSSLASACLYTKYSQELLEYFFGTCPKDFNKRDKQIACTSTTRKKQVTFMAPCDTSTNNTHSHVKQ
ncbi:hypothetical protein Tco_0565961 [Tanacetum coccineum]